MHCGLVLEGKQAIASYLVMTMAHSTQINSTKGILSGILYTLQSQAGVAVHRILVTLLIMIWALATDAQTVKYAHLPGPALSINGSGLGNAWAGGMNAPQPSTINLNGDTIPDLLLFDRIGNKPYTFEVFWQNGTLRYQYNAWYEQRLPEVNSWVLARDFNCDGLTDLFASNPFGIQVWQCTGTGRNFGFVSTGPYVTTAGFGGSQVNLQVNYGDVPSIMDMDGDGDLDILSVGFGSATIEYNQNMSVETTGRCGNVYEKRTACWGRLFLANTCGSYTTGSCRVGATDTTSASPWVSGARLGPAQLMAPMTPQAPMHQGTTLLLRDLNGDGALDLLTGDVGCTALYALINQGTTAAPLFNNREPVFPTGTTAAEFFSFLGGATLDADRDGKDDLVVFANLERNEGFLANLQISTWLYKNTGTQNSPQFQFQTNGFMQNTMLDAGEAAYPVLADADGDGDNDLFVGHAARRVGSQVGGTIWYLENVGTAQQASFVLRDTDWLGLSSYNEVYHKFTFQDLNGDGAPDLLLTSLSNSLGTNFNRFALNQTAAGRGLQFTASSLQNFALNLGFMASPVFTDVTSDGLPDLLVGQGSGGIALYINSGTAAAPVFSLNNNDWGGLNQQAQVPNYGVNLAVGDVNNDGTQDLVTGDERGLVRVYYNIAFQGGNRLVPDTSIIKDLQDGTDRSWYLGTFLAPAVGQLAGDARADVLLGLRGGGLLYLENVTQYPLSVADELKQPALELSCYPNPAHDQLHVKTTPNAEVRVTDILGRTLWQGLADENGILSLKTQSFSTISSGSGQLVLVHAQYAGQSMVQKVLIR